MTRKQELHREKWSTCRAGSVAVTSRAGTETKSRSSQRRAAPGLTHPLGGADDARRRPGGGLYNPLLRLELSLMRLLGKALTFDDVLLVPAYSQVLPRDTSL